MQREIEELRANIALLERAAQAAAEETRAAVRRAEHAELLLSEGLDALASLAPGLTDETARQNVRILRSWGDCDITIRDEVVTRHPDGWRLAIAMRLSVLEAAIEHGSPRVRAEVMRETRRIVSECATLSDFRAWVDARINQLTYDRWDRRIATPEELPAIRGPAPAPLTHRDAMRIADAVRAQAIVVSGAGRCSCHHARCEHDVLGEDLLREVDLSAIVDSVLGEKP